MIGAQCPFQNSIEHIDIFLSFFSLLRSGTHIIPHSGPTNMRIRVHLGLKIPKTEDKNNSYMRVADQLLHWQDGEM